MVALVFVIIFVLIAIVSLLIGFSKKPKSNKNSRNYDDESNERTIAFIVSGAATFIAFVIFLIGSIVIIPNGNVAVMVKFGQVTGNTLDAGMHWKSIIENPIVMSIQTQKYEVDCEAASKDLQDVTSKIAVNYKLDKAKSVEIYRTIGVNYFEVVGQPAIQEVVKAITAQYNAEDMILKREAVKGDIAEALRQRLAERGIISEAVNMTNFAFSPEFTAAIEAKVSAAQAVLQAQNQLERIRVEAQQAEAAAIGKANAAIAAANGEAQAIQIVTDAQVAANKKIAETLTTEVIQYDFIDRMGDNVQVWVVPEGQSFNINPSTVSK